MLEVIKTLLFVIISVITSTYVNVKLSHKKINFKITKTWIILGIITFLILVLWEYNYGVSKTLFIYFIWVISYKCLLKTEWNESIIINFIK